MNTLVKPETTRVVLRKNAGSLPALIVSGPSAIAVRAGTMFGTSTFGEDTPVIFNEPLEVGCDYGVIVKEGMLGYARLTAAPVDPDILGGFHFAPGGNAAGRSGGDSVPAINPCSLWDQGFRPACPDPRGMALIDMPGKKFWCDIYLLGVNHGTSGTSALGVTIADGDDTPDDPEGKRFKRLDYDTAVAVMKHHGKGLLSVEEFFAAAFGVTEKTACEDEPEKTGLDAARTSRFGIMQATGNMWVWGHDGDPDNPRPSIFGGSWLSGEDAGSRYASVAYYWPGDSDGDVGARGRGDHLQLG